MPRDSDSINEAAGLMHIQSQGQATMGPYALSHLLLAKMTQCAISCFSQSLIRVERMDENVRMNENGDTMKSLRSSGTL